MIDLVPLSKFSERYARGWRIVPGYDLKATDWAATMQSPDHVPVIKSNLERAAEQGTRGWKHSTKPRKFHHVCGR
jgi:hypothetical protein